MFNLDEEKIECAICNKELYFWQGKKAEIIVFYFWLEIRGIFLSLSLGTAKTQEQLVTRLLIMFFINW